MSNIDKTNIKRSKKKDKKIIAIKEIIQNHYTTSPKKVQIFLVEEYKLAIPLSSLKRYLAKIKKEKNKKTKNLQAKKSGVNISQLLENVLKYGTQNLIAPQAKYSGSNPGIRTKMSELKN